MGHNVAAVDFSRDFLEDIREYEDHEQERLVRTVEEFDEDVRLWNVDFHSRTDPLTTPHYDGTLYRQVVGSDEFRIYYERDGDELSPSDAEDARPRTTGTSTLSLDGWGKPFRHSVFGIQTRKTFVPKVTMAKLRRRPPRRTSLARLLCRKSGLTWSHSHF